MSATAETFDLGPVRAIQKRYTDRGRALAAVGAVVIGVIDTVVVITNRGLSLGAPLLLVQMTVSFVLVAFLAWAALFYLDAGPVRLVLSSEGMLFESVSGKQREYRWNDPSLDLSILDFTGIHTDKPRLRPLFPFMLRGQGSRAYSPICLTVEAGTAIIQEARAHELALSEQGTPGSLPAGSLSPHETRIQGREAASRSRSGTGVPI